MAKNSCGQNQSGQKFKTGHAVSLAAVGFAGFVDSFFIFYKSGRKIVKCKEMFTKLILTSPFIKNISKTGLLATS